MEICLVIMESLYPDEMETRLVVTETRLFCLFIVVKETLHLVVETIRTYLVKSRHAVRGRYGIVVFIAGWRGSRSRYARFFQSFASLMVQHFG